MLRANHTQENQTNNGVRGPLEQVDRQLRVKEMSKMALHPKVEALHGAAAAYHFLPVTRKNLVATFRYPPGAPVILCRYQQPRQAADGVKPMADDEYEGLAGKLSPFVSQVLFGRVAGVGIDFGSSKREDLYRVNIENVGISRAGCGSDHSFVMAREEELVLAKGCPVWFDLGQGKEEGVVLGSQHIPLPLMTTAKNPLRLSYSIQATRGRLVVHHGVDADKVSFRLDTPTQPKQRRRLKEESDVATKKETQADNGQEDESVVATKKEAQADHGQEDAVQAASGGDSLTEHPQFCKEEENSGSCMESSQCPGTMAEQNDFAMVGSEEPTALSARHVSILPKKFEDDVALICNDSLDGNPSLPVEEVKILASIDDATQAIKSKEGELRSQQELRPQQQLTQWMSALGREEDMQKGALGDDGTEQEEDVDLMVEDCSNQMMVGAPSHCPSSEIIHGVGPQPEVVTSSQGLAASGSYEIAKGAHVQPETVTSQELTASALLAGRLPISPAPRVEHLQLEPVTSPEPTAFSLRAGRRTISPGPHVEQCKTGETPCNPRSAERKTVVDQMVLHNEAVGARRAQVGEALQQVKDGLRQTRSAQLFDLLLRYGSLSRCELAGLVRRKDRGHGFSYSLRELKQQGLVEEDPESGETRVIKLRLSDKVFARPEDRPEPEFIDPRILAEAVAWDKSSKPRNRIKTYEDSDDDSVSTIDSGDSAAIAPPCGTTEGVLHLRDEGLKGGELLLSTAHLTSVPHMKAMLQRAQSIQRDGHKSPKGEGTSTGACPLQREVEQEVSLNEDCHPVRCTGSGARRTYNRESSAQTRQQKQATGYHSYTGRTIEANKSGAAVMTDVASTRTAAARCQDPNSLAGKSSPRESRVNGTNPQRSVVPSIPIIHKPKSAQAPRDPLPTDSVNKQKQASQAIKDLDVWKKTLQVREKIVSDERDADPQAKKAPQSHFEVGDPPASCVAHDDDITGATTKDVANDANSHQTKRTVANDAAPDIVDGANSRQTKRPRGRGYNTQPHSTPPPGAKRQKRLHLHAKPSYEATSMSSSSATAIDVNLPYNFGPDFLVNSIMGDGKEGRALCDNFGCSIDIEGSRLHGSPPSDKQLAVVLKGEGPSKLFLCSQAIENRLCHFLPQTLRGNFLFHIGKLNRYRKTYKGGLVQTQDPFCKTGLGNDKQLHWVSILRLNDPNAPPLDEELDRFHELQERFSSCEIRLVRKELDFPRVPCHIVASSLHRDDLYACRQLWDDWSVHRQ
ncbi:expressed unknown protein [Seminavis robusta]|uniref:Uncharacterized protein n=1 Tax=Seminavis robusta TaxID=568900 RepID=A0A9N8E219_9STRA|nr:expressed unknown protein [Seminavis robusta]|eukprot:Sro573_g168970.1 n/a (1253) ;mRNA; f:24260-28018